MVKQPTGGTVWKMLAGKAVLFRIFFVFMFLAYAALSSAPSANAVTPLSQGYETTTAIAGGSIVSLQNDQSDIVVPTYTDNQNTIIGVVINDNSSVLTLTDGSKSEVQVATTGVVPVLVSDINGPIQEGDQITASPIKGVGMKVSSDAKVIGIAQSTPTNDVKDTYKDSDGKEQTVTLGQVNVLINVSYYTKQPTKTIVPAALQNVANAIAGKNVETLPIVIAAIIFFITLVIVSSIIYSMIRSSIISVGRNPMSQSAIYRDVIQLSVLVLGILAVAIISIYIVLTRF